MTIIILFHTIDKNTQIEKTKLRTRKVQIDD